MKNSADPEPDRAVQAMLPLARHIQVANKCSPLASVLGSFFTQIKPLCLPLLQRHLWRFYNFPRLFTDNFSPGFAYAAGGSSPVFTFFKLNYCIRNFRVLHTEYMS